MIKLNIPWAVAMWPVSLLHKVPEARFVWLLLTRAICQGSKLPPSKKGGRAGRQFIVSVLVWLWLEMLILRKRENILVPCAVYVILLPYSLHHLAGQPARDFAPMKSVVRAVAIGCRGQLEPPLGRLIIWGDSKKIPIVMWPLTEIKSDECGCVYILPVWASSGDVGGVRVTEDMAGSLWAAWPCWAPHRLTEVLAEPWGTTAGRSVRGRSTRQEG